MDEIQGKNVLSTPKCLNFFFSTFQNFENLKFLNPLGMIFQNESFYDIISFFVINIIP